MPAWSEVKEEIEKRNDDFDGVRRGYIRAVEKITGRPLIIYATAFMSRDKVQASGGAVSIDDYDRLGFEEATSGIEGDSLDVLIHSPGGSPEVAEAIISLLRSKFNGLRFIVPHMAKSAATMMCCAADEILMDNRSELGPIDPQIVLRRGDAIVQAPAQAILRQFDKAKESLANNPKEVAAWLPLLQPLAPSLLTECESANELARTLVEAWLKTYMLKDDPNREEKSRTIAAFLSDSSMHLSHARQIRFEHLTPLGMKITDMRLTPDLRNTVWKLFQAIHWTLERTAAFKIIENGHGGAFIRQIQFVHVNLPPGNPVPPPLQRQAHKKKK